MTTISKNCHLAILGPSGGGKGTQAELLANHFGWRHISIGQLLREEEKKATPTGRRLRRYVDKGLLVPGDLTLEILFAALGKIIPAGFILDGAPRTFYQAQEIDRFLRSRRCPLNLVILLEVPEEVILHRRQQAIAAGRRFQPGRDDDKEAILRQRLREYEKNIGPIKNFYREKGILAAVDGNRPINVIQKDIRRLIENEK